MMLTEEQYMEELAESYRRELNIAKTSFAKDKSPKVIYKAVKEFYRRLDKQITRNVDRHNIPLACKKGCSHCCTLRVEVFGYEVIALARYIREYFSGNELLAIIKNLEEASEKAKGLKMEEHIIPCALLNDGVCSIYEMRPGMCRKFSSMSLEACLNDNQGAESKGLKESTMAAFQGFVEGARHSGLKDAIYELNQALYLAVVDPSAAKKWVSGLSVFTPIPPMPGRG